MELFPFFFVIIQRSFQVCSRNFIKGVVNPNRFRIFSSGRIKWTNKARLSFTIVTKAKKQLDGAKIV